MKRDDGRDRADEDVRCGDREKKMTDRQNKASSCGESKIGSGSRRDVPCKQRRQGEDSPCMIAHLRTGLSPLESCCLNQQQDMHFCMQPDSSRAYVKYRKSLQ